MLCVGVRSDSRRAYVRKAPPAALGRPPSAAALARGRRRRSGGGDEHGDARLGVAAVRHRWCEGMMAARVNERAPALPSPGVVSRGRPKTVRRGGRTPRWRARYGLGGFEVGGGREWAGSVGGGDCVGGGRFDEATAATCLCGWGGTLSGRVDDDGLLDAAARCCRERAERHPHPRFCAKRRKSAGSSHERSWLTMCTGR